MAKFITKKIYSEHTKKLIDTEVKRVSDAQAKHLIKYHGWRHTTKGRGKNLAKRESKI